MKRNVQHNICMTRQDDFKRVSGVINPTFISLFCEVVSRKEKKINSNVCSASPTMYQSFRCSPAVPFELVERGYFN